jgi:hypothetical protein
MTSKKIIKILKIFIILVLLVGFYGYFKNWIKNSSDQLDYSGSNYSKFKELGQFTEDSIPDTEKLLNYRSDEVDSIDFENTKEKLRHLDIFKIYPKANIDKAILELIDLSEKMRLQVEEIDQILYEEQKSVNVDAFLNKRNLSNEKTILDNLTQIEILKISNKKYIANYIKIYDEFKNNLTSRISEKEILNEILKGISIKYDLSIKLNDAIYKSYEMNEKINRFCLTKLATGKMISYEDSGYELNFTTDEEEEKFDKLVEENYLIYLAQQNAKENLISK